MFPGNIRQGHNYSVNISSPFKAQKVQAFTFEDLVLRKELSRQAKRELIFEFGNFQQ